MTKTTLWMKIAIMVAAGFEENNFIEIQKMLMVKRATE